MTKFYFFIIAYWCLNSVYGQYTLNATSNPIVGDVEAYKKIDSTGLQLGSGGTGQTWNYTGAVINTTASINSRTYTAISSVPNNTLFPGANIASNNGSGSYSVYNNSASKIDYLGAASSSTTNCIYYSNSIVMLPLPFSYGSNNVDPFSGTSPIYTISGTFTATGHGSGTLLLPTGTYGNVLKVRQAYVQVLVMTTTTLNINTIQDSYYSAINKFPLFTVGCQTITQISGTTTVSYNKGGEINTALVTGITVQENDVPEFNLFPNPAVNGNVNLVFSINKNENCLIEIYNSIGQNVKSISLGEQIQGIVTKNIDLGDLESGIYYLKLKTGTFEQSKRLTLTK